MADRRAPRGGYDFGNKRQYRRAVWASFRRFCEGGAGVAAGLLMPSLEGDEVDVAVRAGFRQRNLWLLDRNAAILATLKRDRFPHVNTLGVALRDAGRRFKEKGGDTIDVANLDLCSNVNVATLKEIAAFASSGVVRHGEIAVTALRGRESGESLEMVDGLTQATAWSPASFEPGSDVVSCQAAGVLPDREEDRRDCGRLAAIGAALEGVEPWGAAFRREKHVERYVRSQRLTFLCRRGVYWSPAAHQTMLWAVYKVHAAPCICNLCLSVARIVCAAESNRSPDEWSMPDVLRFAAAAYKCTPDDLLDMTYESLRRQPALRQCTDESARRIIYNEQENARVYD